MDIFLWRLDEYERLYNCTYYDVNQIPIEKRQHKIIGFLFILTFLIYEVKKFLLAQKLLFIFSLCL